MFTTAVPPPPPAKVRVQRPHTLLIALFFAAIVWYFCARALAASAASGLVVRFDVADLQPLLESLFLLFLVVVGLSLLRAIERRRAPLRLALGLPRRATSRAEWLTGAAIGWGLAVASVLSMALGRTLNVRLWTTLRAFELLVLSLATLAVATLATDIGVRGYAFQRLIDAVGSVRATVVMALMAALYSVFAANPHGAGAGSRVLVEILVSILLSLAWIRTQAVWLLWGLHLAWAAATGALFGLPLGGDTRFASVVETRTIGPFWLTGGSYGSFASLLSVLFVLAAIPILVRVTSDYAWAYTHPPLIPAGYDVTVAPPAAHVAMEQANQPVTAASLVQILPASPPPER